MYPMKKEKVFIVSTKPEDMTPEESQRLLDLVYLLRDCHKDPGQLVQSACGPDKLIYFRGMAQIDKADAVVMMAGVKCDESMVDYARKKGKQIFSEEEYLWKLHSNELIEDNFPLEPAAEPAKSSLWQAPGDDL